LQAEIGELAVGKKADLILLDMTEIGWSPTPTNAIFTALVYSVNGLHVTDSMVDGHWLMRDRRLQTLDYAQSRRQQQNDIQRLIARRKEQQT
jgi:5-methylthioadenosine/S-adenosylhomocysteine deaminase